MSPGWQLCSKQRGRTKMPQPQKSTLHGMERIRQRAREDKLHSLLIKRLPSPEVGPQCPPALPQAQPRSTEVLTAQHTWNAPHHAAPVAPAVGQNDGCTAHEGLIPACGNWLHCSAAACRHSPGSSQGWMMCIENSAPAIRNRTPHLRHAHR